MASAGRGAVERVLQTVAGSGCSCPAHSQAFSGYRILPRNVSASCLRQSSAHPGAVADREYAFEMACSNIRYGEGVTREVGMDLENLGVRNVCVLTDKNLAKLPPLKATLNSLQSSSVQYSVYDNVSIEPTNESFEDAISFARKNQFDGFLAVGGGSVMDTAKVANLLSCCPENELLDFTNAPVGKGQPVTKLLKPLVCIPTTAGTGSETTGTAIFDYKPLRAKTGIGSRALRPLLGIIDPLHMRHMPTNVAIFSGFDVLCHALEAYTAIPYKERTPRPSNPILRPSYQGSNPISDIWSLHALKIMRQYFKRAVRDAEDQEARSAMHLASVYAGVGFGNAGVHLCHGMSYPISGLVKSFRSADYDQTKPLVPHGLSVVLTAPAVFQFTAPLCPERHLHAAELLGGTSSSLHSASNCFLLQTILDLFLPLLSSLSNCFLLTSSSLSSGADVNSAQLGDAGKILADVLRQYMADMRIVDGLKAVGYSSEDIPALVKGTLPQHRVTKLSPRTFTEEQLAKMFEDSLTVYK